MQLSPSESLRSVVRHYLFIHDNSCDETRLRFFSDTSPAIVFLFDSQFEEYLASGETRHLPSAFLYGQITRPRDLRKKGAMSLLAIVLEPHALALLTGFPSWQLSDQFIPVEDLFGKEIRELYDQLNLIYDWQSKIILIEKFLVGRLAKQNFDGAAKLEGLIGLIRQKHGIVKIADMAMITGLSERSVQRRFREKVGIDPQQFSNVTRMHYFLRQMRICNNSTLTSLSYDAGYFDQAHLIREFTKISGMTPRHYKYKTRPLAVNFVQL